MEALSALILSKLWFTKLGYLVRRKAHPWVYDTTCRSVGWCGFDHVSREMTCPSYTKIGDFQLFNDWYFTKILPFFLVAQNYLHFQHWDVCNLLTYQKNHVVFAHISRFQTLRNPTIFRDPTTLEVRSEAEKRTCSASKSKPRDMGNSLWMYAGR